MVNKEELRHLFDEHKQETLIKNTSLINKYRDEYEENLNKVIYLVNDNITIEFCETKEQIQKWKAFVHLTTSLPWKGAVGRQVKYFVKCNDAIIGMIHLTSPLAQCAVRDAYCNFDNKWEDLKHIYNIEGCVSISTWSNLLTGKLCLYTVFSNEVKEYLCNKYNCDVIGFETTSLYGKSSIYNRIPFFKYLGLTEGLSAVYISDDDWRKLWAEYQTVYPNTKTNRLAPVKFQIVDKMAKYYKKIGKEFPYTYSSTNFKRGVYFGYCIDKSLEEQINDWRNRWLIGRIKRLNEKDVEFYNLGD